jgi:hypothetical protein
VSLAAVARINVGEGQAAVLVEATDNPLEGDGLFRQDVLGMPDQNSLIASTRNI